MIHTGKGEISVDDILRATARWFTHSDFHPEAPVVWDIRDAMLQMTIQEMPEMYSLVRKAVTSKRTGGKTAWVHPSGMVRSMIKVVGDEFDWGSEWQVFMALDDAVEWCLDAS